MEAEAEIRRHVGVRVLLVGKVMFRPMDFGTRIVRTAICGFQTPGPPPVMTRTRSRRWASHIVLTMRENSRAIS